MKGFGFEGEIQLKQEDIEKLDSLFASEEMLCKISVVDEKGNVLDEKKGENRRAARWHFQVFRGLINDHN